MTLRPCLTCGTPAAGSRCPTHTAERKHARNTSARNLGPCPQTGPCARCGNPATADDPFTWGHTTPRGGATDWDDPTANPEHRSCNSRARDR